MVAFRATTEAAGGTELADVQVDHSDLAILRELSADGALTNKALAARVGLPESTCAYRVRALRDRGVITGDNVRLDLPALGYPIQAVIKVRLGSHGAEHVNALYDDLVRIPGVLEAIHVAGADEVAVGARPGHRPRVGGGQAADARTHLVEPARDDVADHLLRHLRHGAGVGDGRGHLRGRRRRPLVRAGVVAHRCTLQSCDALARAADAGHR